MYCEFLLFRRSNFETFFRFSHNIHNKNGRKRKKFLSGVKNSPTTSFQANFKFTSQKRKVSGLVVLRFEETIGEKND